MQFDIQINDERVLDALDGYLKRSQDLAPAMEIISGVLADATDRAFINQQDPESDAPWAPLSPHTADRIVNGKRRGETPILQVTGILAQSFRPEWGSDYALVATNDIRAGTHQFGAAQGEYGQTENGRPIPFGDIPARRMLGISSEDVSEILEIFALHMSN
ncbi:MAG: phage virion morphogenesis protein [Gammaproteobacteria bacterium]|nr:phage virion morphogenesis protein [Gammaproteobacteria bacterium]